MPEILEYQHMYYVLRIFIYLSLYSLSASVSLYSGRVLASTTARHGSRVRFPRQTKCCWVFQNISVVTRSLELSSISNGGSAYPFGEKRRDEMYYLDFFYLLAKIQISKTITKCLKLSLSKALYPNNRQEIYFIS